CTHTTAWSGDWWLTFSLDKTQALVFSRKKRPVPPPAIPLSLYNQPLTLTPNYKYLGLLCTRRFCSALRRSRPQGHIHSPRDRPKVQHQRPISLPRST